MNDDFNTAVLVAQLFEGVRIINSVNAGTETITENDLTALKKLFKDFVFGVLGLLPEKTSDNSIADGLMNLILSIRNEAKIKKDFSTSDKIRDSLKQLNIQVKDDKDGTANWTFQG